jgi:hypothetical protein
MDLALPLPCDVSAPGRVWASEAMRVRLDALAKPPDHPPLTICAGVITSDPRALHSLLLDLRGVAAGERIDRLVVVVLNNGAPAEVLDLVAAAVASSRLRVVVVHEATQRADASLGSFGSALRQRPSGRVGIASARTMLQRYVGTLMAQTPAAFGWLLDDDMRVDVRAHWYLSWLPAFRAQDVDVLIGGIEGASPNPPLHGVQGQLFDLIHNVTWLRGLEPSATLPDRAAENASQREMFPDYYYDLSRRHTAHLDHALWIERVREAETVAQAYERLVAGARAILAGAPLTRPLIAPMPADPLASARESVNRGGHTFVLNHRALTDTPNPTLYAGTTEARRSDMFWAIINRYYRGLSVKAVAFPAVHVGRAEEQPTLDIEKVAAELAGAALYAGLTAFLHNHPEHRLAFSTGDAAWIAQSAARFRRERLDALSRSFERVVALRELLRAMARPGELADLIATLDVWFTPDVLTRVHAGASSFTSRGVVAFLRSMRRSADDYAAAPRPDISAARTALLHGGVT